MVDRRRLLVMMRVGLVLAAGLVAGLVVLADDGGSNAAPTGRAQAERALSTTSTRPSVAVCTNDVCSERTPSRHPIDSVDVVDETHLTVRLGCSWGDPLVDVVESATEVRLRATYIDTHYACAHLSRIVLRTPLDSRPVIDDLTAPPVTLTNGQTRLP